MTLPDLSIPGSSIYQSLLEQAARSGSGMLSQAITVARQSMRAEVQRARGVLDRDQLELGAKWLELTLCALVGFEHVSPERNPLRPAWLFAKH